MYLFCIQEFGIEHAYVVVVWNTLVIKIGREQVTPKHLLFYVVKRVLGSRWGDPVILAHDGREGVWHVADAVV